VSLILPPQLRRRIQFFGLPIRNRQHMRSSHLESLVMMRWEVCVMTYDELAPTYLVPATNPIEGPVLPTSTASRLRDALEPIATRGRSEREHLPPDFAARAC